MACCSSFKRRCLYWRPLARSPSPSGKPLAEGDTSALSSPPAAAAAKRAPSLLWELGRKGGSERGGEVAGAGLRPVWQNLSGQRRFPPGAPHGRVAPNPQHPATFQGEGQACPNRHVEPESQSETGAESFRAAKGIRAPGPRSAQEELGIQISWVAPKIPAGDFKPCSRLQTSLPTLPIAATGGVEPLVGAGFGPRGFCWRGWALGPERAPSRGVVLSKGA